MNIHGQVSRSIEIDKVDHPCSNESKESILVVRSHHMTRCVVANKSSEQPWKYSLADYTGR